MKPFAASEFYPILRFLLVLFFGTGSLLGGFIQARAEESKGGISGKWKIETRSRDGNVRKTKANFTQEGDKLHGTFRQPDGSDIWIRDGKVNGDEISFNFTRQFGGRETVIKYVGKIVGDKLEGTSEFEREGEVRKSPWTAVRDLPPEGASGTWKWTFKREDGHPAEFTLKLKQEGDQLTGVSVSPSGNENPITESKVEGDKVSFKVVRVRDDRKFTTQFNGTRKENAITGKIDVDWTGENRTYDWKANRVED